jgi:hypothetical protein
MIIAAVAADLIHGLKHYEAGRSSEALWWWQYSYVNQWGTCTAAPRCGRCMPSSRTPGWTSRRRAPQAEGPLAGGRTGKPPAG